MIVRQAYTPFAYRVFRFHCCSGGIHTLCLPNIQIPPLFGRHTHPLPTEHPDSTVVREAYTPFAYRTSRFHCCSGGIRTLRLPNIQIPPLFGRHTRPHLSDSPIFTFIQPYTLSDAHYAIRIFFRLLVYSPIPLSTHPQLCLLPFLLSTGRRPE